MTTIDVTTAQNDSVQGGSARIAETPDLGTSGIPLKVIDQAVAHGRRLRSQAIAAAFSGLGYWVVTTVKGALGRRATNKLGCGECGDMMRA